ncbi:pentapeptide repeat-containing protein [Trichothermofontia sp.]
MNWLARLRTVVFPVVLLISLVGWLCLGWGSQPTAAALLSTERVPLTLELLKQRLRQPVRVEGYTVIDLQNLVIDLSPENAGFREQFYTLLRSQLAQTNPTIGLDLSQTIVEGSFDLSQLSVRLSSYQAEQSPLFSPPVQAQLRYDQQRLSQLQQLSRSLLSQSRPEGETGITVFQGLLRLQNTQFQGAATFTNIFFLGPVQATGVIFLQDVDWSATRFSKVANFIGAHFQKVARFRNSIFFDQARFSQAQFQGEATFQSSRFDTTASFNQVMFQQPANFSRGQWQGNADFSQSTWQAAAELGKGKFLKSLLLTNATLNQSLNLREASFNQPINLRGVTLSGAIDFSDADFLPQTYINVSSLKFESDTAKILGNAGQIGALLSVPTLQGNETVLRNLVRRFRQLEQIADANAIEYLTQCLRLQQLTQQLVRINLNTASPQKLIQLGFSPQQADLIVQTRSTQLFHSFTELLSLKGIDLATYVNVRDRVTIAPPITVGDWFLKAFDWIALSILLRLSGYGTQFCVIFGVGIVAIAYFGVLFWVIDRARRLHPTPIVPSFEEGLWVMGGGTVLITWGLSALFQVADHPWQTLFCLAILIVPVPMVLTGWLYRQGRHHDLMNSSYFTEDSSFRQLRLLIGRLPVIPRFPFFRDRYVPLPWGRRWNWLNYYDFSFNNLLKFGFNDIRLRDEHVPGLVTALVWYQWTLGLFYLSLLLWTLSRTIPGLNLLIYFK